jgi:hypothetical protein
MEKYLCAVKPFPFSDKRAAIPADATGIIVSVVMIFTEGRIKCIVSHDMGMQEMSFSASGIALRETFGDDHDYTHKTADPEVHGMKMSRFILEQPSHHQVHDHWNEETQPADTLKYQFSEPLVSSHMALNLPM